MDFYSPRSCHVTLYIQLGHCIKIPTVWKVSKVFHSVKFHSILWFFSIWFCSIGVNLKILSFHFLVRSCWGASKQRDLKVSNGRWIKMINIPQPYLEPYLQTSQNPDHKNRKSGDDTWLRLVWWMSRLGLC